MLPDTIHEHSYHSLPFCAGGVPVELGVSEGSGLRTTRLELAQQAALASLPEGHLFDRKSIRISPAKLTKAISALANADGGELLIGIEDDGTWSGAASVEAFNGFLQAFEPLFPYGTEFDYEFFELVDGTFVMRVTVQKSREVKFASDGRVCCTDR